MLKDRVKRKDVPSDPSPASPSTPVSGKLLAGPVLLLKCCCTRFEVLLCWVFPSVLEIHQSKYLMRSGLLWIWLSNVWLSDEYLCTNRARFYKKKKIASKHLDLRCKGFANLELVLQVFCLCSWCRDSPLRVTVHLYFSWNVLSKISEFSVK